MAIKHHSNENFLDNNKLTFGTSDDLQLYHDGSNSNIVDTGTGYLSLRGSDLRLQDSSGWNYVICTDTGSGGEVALLHENVEVFKTVTGGVTITGTLTVGVDDTGYDVKFFGATSGRYLHWDESQDSLRLRDNVKMKVGNDGDFQVWHDGSNTFLSNEGAGHLNIQNTADDKDIIFKSDDGSGGTTAYLTLDGGLGYTTVQKQMNFGDGVVLALGASLDLQLFHESDNSFVQNYIGDLTIRNFADDKDIIFQSDDGSGGVATYFFLDGSLANSGTVFTTFPDNSIAAFGNSLDLRIFHDGTNNYIENQTNDLYLVNHANDKDIIFQSDNGSGGVETYFFLDGSTGHTQFPDAKKLQFGSSNDMFIEHDGSNSYISSDVGTFYIRQTLNDGDLVLTCDDGSGGNTAYVTLDGSAETVEIAKNTNFAGDVTINGSHLKLLNHSGSYEGAATDYLYIGGSGLDGADAAIYLGNAGNNTGYGWRFYYAGSGSGNDNKLIIKSENAGSGVDALSFTQDGNATFAGDVNTGDDLNVGDDVNIAGDQLTFTNDAASAYIRAADTLFIESDFDDDDGGSKPIYFRTNGTEMARMEATSATFAGSVTSTKLNVNQAADDQGLQINGYDDRSGSTATLRINSAGHTTLSQTTANGSGYLFLTAENYLQLSAGSLVYTQNQFRIYDAGSLTFGNSGDSSMRHDGSNFAFQNTTGNVTFTQNLVDGDIIFKADNGSGGVENYIQIDGSEGRTLFNKHLRVNDSVELQVGAAADLRITHDSTNSYIQNYTGNLLIKTQENDSDIVFYSDDGNGSEAVYFRLDGSAATHDGSATTALYTNWSDKSRISLGSSHDLQIFHNATSSFIENTTGNLTLVNYADDADIVLSVATGSANPTPYLTLDGSAGRTIANLHLQMADGKALYVGDGLDAGFYHSSGHNYIENNTGNLTFVQNTDDGDIIFQSDDGSGGLSTYLTINGSTGYVNLQDSRRLTFGGGNDMHILHDGSDNYIKGENGDLHIRNDANDKDIVLSSDDGSGNVTPYITLDGSVGHTTVQKEMHFQDAVVARFGTDDDAQIVHSGSSLSMVNQTGNFNIVQNANDGDITLQCDDGSGGTATYITLDGSAGYTTVQKAIRFEDSVQLQIGTGGDAGFLHDGSNAVLFNSTGHFYIRNDADDSDLILQSDDGSGGRTAYITLDGGLGYTAVHKHMAFADSTSAIFGAAADLELNHDGNDSFITARNTDLKIQQLGDDKDIIFQSDDGSGGTASYFRLDGSEVETRFHKATLHFDNVKAKFGDSGDLQILHDGNNSFIHHNTTGDLEIKADVGDIKIVNYTNDKDIIFKSDDGSGGVTPYITLDGSQEAVVFGKAPHIPQYINHVDDGDTAFGFADNDVFRIITGGTTRFNIGGGITMTGNTTITGTLTVGADDTGHDVIFYGATSSKKMQWDESADTLIVDGELDINGTANISGQLTTGGTVVTGGNHNISSSASTGFYTPNINLVITAANNSSATGGISFKTNNAGTATERMSISAAGTAAFAGNVTIAGSLTTEGDFIVNTTSNLSIKDTIISLNEGITGSDTRDIGIMFERVGNNKFIGWDESEDYFILAENTQDVSAAVAGLTMGTLQTLRANVHLDTLSVGSENPTSITAILDEDNMSSNSATSLATQQSIKAYADTMLPLAGGTMTGEVTLNGTDGHINLDGNNAAIFDNTNNNNAYYIRNGGSNSATLQIGTGSPGSNIKLTLDGSGNATFAGSITASSSSSAQLQVSGYSDSNGANNANGSIYLGNTAAYRGVIDYDAASTGSLIISNTWNNDAGNIIFKTKTAGTDVIPLTLSGSGNATFGGNVTADTIVINDIDSTRGVFRNNAAYDLRLGGGTVYTDGAYISLSGGTRGGGTSSSKGRVEIFSGGSNYSAQADITGDIVIGTQWNGGTSNILWLDSSSNNATFAGDVITTDGSDTATLSKTGLTLSRSNSYIQSNADNSDTLNIGQSSVRWGHVKVDGADFAVLNGGNERFKINSSGNATFAGDVTLSSTAPIFYLDNTTSSTGKKWRLSSAANGKMYITQDGVIDVITLDHTTGNATFAGDITLGANYIGRDAHNIIDFATDNHITFKTDQSTALQIDSNQSVKVIAGSLQISGDNANFATLTESGSGDFTIDAADDIRLDAGGGDVVLKAGGTEYGRLSNSSADFVIQNTTSDKDILFKGNDNGSTITALILDMSDAGSAYFGHDVRVYDGGQILIGTGSDLSLTHDATNTYISNDTGDLYIQNGANGKDVILRCDDGSNGLTPYITLDGGSNEIKFYKTLSNQANVNLVMGGGQVKFNDSGRLYMGDSNDLQIYHDGTDNQIESKTGDLVIKNTAHGEQIYFKAEDGSGTLATYLTIDGSLGYTTVQKDMQFADSVDIKLGSSNDCTIFHDGTDTWIDNGTGTLKIRNQNDDGDITFYCDDGSGGTTEYFRLDGGGSLTFFSKHAQLADNVNLYIGDAGDAAIYHDGSNTYIKNATGDLYIQNGADDKDIIFQSDDGSGGTETYFYLNGGLSSPYTVFPDTSHLGFGNSLDLIIHHDTANSYITANGTGDLILSQETDDKDIIFRSDDGSGGVTAYITLDGSTTKVSMHKEVDFGSHLNLIDNANLNFGAGQDLQIYHSSSNNIGFIKNNNAAGLRIQSDELLLFAQNGSTLRADFGTSVDLYYNDAKKLETTSGGINVTGTVTAAKLSTDTVTIVEDAKTDTALMTLTGAGAGTEANVALKLSGTVHGNPIKMKMVAENASGNVTGAGMLSYEPDDDNFNIGQSTTHNRMGVSIGNTVTIGDSDIIYQEDVTIKSRAINMTANSNHYEFNGDIMKIGDDTTVRGKLYNYKNGTWTLADKDAEADADGLLAMAVGTNSTTHGMLLRGTMTLDYDPGGAGDVLYVGDSGVIQNSAPSGSGDIVRIVGYLLGGTHGNIFFDPDKTFVEVA